MKVKYRLYVFDINGKLIEEHESILAYAIKQDVSASTIYNYIYRSACFNDSVYLSTDNNFTVIKSKAVYLSDKRYYIFRKIRDKIGLSYVASSKASCTKFILENTGRFIDDIRYYVDRDNGLIENEYCIFTFNKFPLSDEEKKYQLKIDEYK